MGQQVSAWPPSTCGCRVHCHVVPSDPRCGFSMRSVRCVTMSPAIVGAPVAMLPDELPKQRPPDELAALLR